MTDRALEDRDIDGLASEYVLGSLTPQERASVQMRTRHDPRLAAAIAAWEQRLALLSHRERGVEPPSDALEGILANVLRDVTTERVRTLAALRRRAQVWRAAATGTAMAAAAVVAMWGLSEYRGSLAPSSPVVAVLSGATANNVADERARAADLLFVVVLDARSRTVQVRQIGGRAPPGERAYTLWLIDADASRTTAIGVIPRTGQAAHFRIDGRASSHLDGATAVISLEASPLPAAPRGPVLATAKLEAHRP